MKLLHLTYDYPDEINPDKTVAMKNIIDLKDNFGNSHCISLNRTSKLNNKLILKKGNVTALNTFGLSRGIFFKLTLSNSIKRVLATGLSFKSFDMVHAHKLSFEGPIAYYLHRKFNLPYLITIQQTDFKVFKFKPFMKGFYFKILSKATQIILISPWMERQLNKVFGIHRMKKVAHKLCSIPLIVERKQIQKGYDNGRFICVFHMRESYLRIKNIYRTLKAISKLKKAGIIIRLDIAGDGPASYRVKKMIEKLQLNSQVKMLGRIENDRIIKFMSEYRAFILLSYPETFGMVYIEALSAGIPIIYSKDTGIDGFFDDLGIGIAVCHKSLKEMCNALNELNNNPEKFKNNVQKLQESGYLSQFSKDSIKQKYNLVLSSISKK